MKKIIVILAMALALPAATAFAAMTTSSQAAPTVGGFNPTNKVSTAYIGNTAGSAWAAVSGHAAGDKEYWTSSAFGGIAAKSVTVGAGGAADNATGAPSSPTDSAVPSAYTTM